MHKKQYSCEVRGAVLGFLASRASAVGAEDNDKWLSLRNIIRK